MCVCVVYVRVDPLFCSFLLFYTLPRSITDVLYVFHSSLPLRDTLDRVNQIHFAFVFAILFLFVSFYYSQHPSLFTWANPSRGVSVCAMLNRRLGRLSRCQSTPRRVTTIVCVYVYACSFLDLDYPSLFTYILYVFVGTSLCVTRSIAD